MSKQVLAIDPGKLMCGVSFFLDSTLVHATLTKNPSHKSGQDGPEVWRETALAVYSAWADYFGSGILNSPHHLVLEVPQIYRTGLQKGDQADIGALFGVDGAIAALFDCPVTWYHPAAWKGQVPKAVMNARIMSRISPEELKAIDAKVPKSLLHNVQDSIGIGLKYLGRLK